MTAAEQLADARRKLGLSLEQIAARTKVSIERLSAIERMDLGRLPSLVYLRGFIRAYAAEVGLDADTTSDRYVSELPDPAALASSKPSAGVYIIPTAHEALAEFESEATSSDAAVPLNASRVVVWPPDDLDADMPKAQMPAHEPAVVGATGSALTKPSRFETSPILPLALALVLAGLGGFLLSANMNRRGDGPLTDSALASPTGASRGSAVTKASDSPERARRTAGGGTRGSPPAAGQAPDAAAAALPDTRTPAASDSNAARATPPAPRDLRAARSSLGPQSQTAVAQPESVSKSIDKAVGPTRSDAKQNTAPSRRESAVADTAVPSAVILVPGSAPAPGATAIVGTADPADDVSGAWNVTSHVEAATVGAYKNLILGFRLQLEQHGNRVVGTGYKVSENGAALSARRRTPINVEGTLDGNRLALNFAAGDAPCERRAVRARSLR